MNRWVAAVGLTLTLAGQVEACAWVLWVESHHAVIRFPGGQQEWREWTLVEARNTQESCDEAMLAKVSQLYQSRLAEKTKFVGSDIEVKLQGNMVSVSRTTRGQQGTQMWLETNRVLCTPDTIDPRGPKGGGR